MKRLYLLRHAQANPSSDTGDKGRKLSPKGLDDAEKLGRMMVKKSYKPYVVLCSPSIRTRQTWEHIGLVGMEDRFPERLYNAGSAAFLEELEELDDDVASVLLIAHNPGIHDFAARLASEDSPQTLMARLMEGFKPGALAVLDCPVESWLDIREEANKLVDFMDPMDYNAPVGPARWT